MQPQNAPRTDGFQPKWRHFHPMARVWVRNPFNHDVVFQVADEYNRPLQYKMPANRVSELPGGAVATLGVKHIVDELIQNDTKDAMQMWDERTRKKHEDNIIIKIKETTAASMSETGEIDLGTGAAEAIDDEEPEAVPETAFPGLNTPPPAPLDQPPQPQFNNDVPPEVQTGITDTIGAALGALPESSIDEAAGGEPAPQQ